MTEIDIRQGDKGQHRLWYKPERKAVVEYGKPEQPTGEDIFMCLSGWKSFYLTFEELEIIESLIDQFRNERNK